MWLLFTRDFDWSPPERRGRVIISYKAGMICLVRKYCADDAIAAAAAEPFTKRKDDHGTQFSSSNG